VTSPFTISICTTCKAQVRSVPDLNRDRYAWIDDRGRTAWPSPYTHNHTAVDSRPALGVHCDQPLVYRPSGIWCQVCYLPQPEVAPWNAETAARGLLYDMTARSHPPVRDELVTGAEAAIIDSLPVALALALTYATGTSTVAPHVDLAARMAVAVLQPGNQRAWHEAHDLLLPGWTYSATGGTRNLDALQEARLMVIQGDATEALAAPVLTDNPTDLDHGWATIYLPKDPA
jgi:hypothetical protein